MGDIMREVRMTTSRMRKMNVGGGGEYEVVVHEVWLWVSQGAGLGAERDLAGTAIVCGVACCPA
jgi:hypothetical protein